MKRYAWYRWIYKEMNFPHDLLHCVFMTFFHDILLCVFMYFTLSLCFCDLALDLLDAAYCNPGNLLTQHRER